MSEQRNNLQENKMGIMPEGKLLASMATPMMISMLVQTCYNIVDSIFVSQLGECRVFGFPDATDYDCRLRWNICWYECASFKGFGCKEF